MILKSSQRLQLLDKKMRHIDSWLMEQDKVFNFFFNFHFLIKSLSTTKNRSRVTTSHSWAPQSHVMKMVKNLSPPFYNNRTLKPNFCLEPKLNFPVQRVLTLIYGSDSMTLRSGTINNS